MAGLLDNAAEEELIFSVDEIATVVGLSVSVTVVTRFVVELVAGLAAGFVAGVVEDVGRFPPPAADEVADLVEFVVRDASPSGLTAIFGLGEVWKMVYRLGEAERMRAMGVEKAKGKICIRQLSARRTRLIAESKPLTQDPGMFETPLGDQRGMFSYSLEARLCKEYEKCGRKE
jgi:hypothetical protein